MKYFDLTVALSQEIPVYPGDPPFQRKILADVETGDVCTVSHLCFGSHTGTHVDPPAHFVAGGKKLDELSLEVLIGKARVVELAEAETITREMISNAGLEGVERVVFKTSNSKLWADSEIGFTTEFVYLETDAAELLVELGVKLVGIDYLSVEKFKFDEPTTHYALLRNDVVIIEGLNLTGVPAGDYELICLPMKVKGGDGAPARVVLRELTGIAL